MEDWIDWSQPLDNQHPEQMRELLVGWFLALQTFNQTIVNTIPLKLCFRASPNYSAHHDFAGSFLALTKSSWIVLYWHSLYLSETVFSSRPRFLSPSSFYIWHFSCLCNIPPITTTCEALRPMTVCWARSNFLCGGKVGNGFCVCDVPLQILSCLSLVLDYPLKNTNDTYNIIHKSFCNLTFIMNGCPPV
jgi:hypothetical protein